MKGHGVKLFPHPSSLELVLADSSDLDDEESVEDFGDLESESYLENCAVRSQDASFSEGSVQPLLPSDRSSLLAEEDDLGPSASDVALQFVSESDTQMIVHMYSQYLQLQEETY
ncbi:PREDICTED: uncharacterized protein LOC107349032 [Acropora digitifera]|uniref:uncharacterized protein LOC107349032 n=1 Tax=Acropora digitifera TaxID=70779 RepID=UPI00077A5E57|nr:PREDICTED: uncharacterized protein LOC107349032 [Acropora digitifera]